jgi:uncharacterized protein YycO
MNAWLYGQYSRFLTFFGDIYFAHEPPLCRAAQIEAMLEVIDAGDVICRGYNSYLDGHFIPGAYTHSGIVLNRREMVHAVAEGVCSIHPIDFVKDTDRFVVLRPSFPRSADAKNVAVSRAVWHCELNKTAYDFTFKDDGRFYCHEFTVDCLAAAGIPVGKTHTTFGVWPFMFRRDLYLADNLIKACATVYEFNPQGGRS